MQSKPVTREIPRDELNIEGTLAAERGKREKAFGGESHDRVGLRFTLVDPAGGWVVRAKREQRIASVRTRIGKAKLPGMFASRIFTS